MEELFKQILSEVKRTNERLDQNNERLDSSEFELKELNRKTAVIFDQTTDLSEFKTTTVDVLNKIEADVEFLTYKGTQTEKAIFNIEHRFTAYR
jgi:chromosome segregation ATPase